MGTGDSVKVIWHHCQPESGGGDAAEGEGRGPAQQNRGADPQGQTMDPAAVRNVQARA